MKELTSSSRETFPSCKRPSEVLDRTRQRRVASAKEDLSYLFSRGLYHFIEALICFESTLKSSLDSKDCSDRNEYISLVFGLEIGCWTMGYIDELEFKDVQINFNETNFMVEKDGSADKSLQYLSTEFHRNPSSSSALLDPCSFIEDRTFLFKIVATSHLMFLPTCW